MTDPQSLVWDKLAAWTGVGMVAPNLQMNISGTSESPQGTIQLQGISAQIPQLTNRMFRLWTIFL
jgi:hypothetical protein